MIRVFRQLGFDLDEFFRINKKRFPMLTKTSRFVAGTSPLWMPRAGSAKPKHTGRPRAGSAKARSLGRPGVDYKGLKASVVSAARSPKASEIAAVVGCRFVGAGKNTLQYLVLWTGKRPSDLQKTWVVAARLTNAGADDAIEAFEEKLMQRGGSGGGLPVSTPVSASSSARSSQQSAAQQPGKVKGKGRAAPREVRTVNKANLAALDEVLDSNYPVKANVSTRRKQAAEPAESEDEGQGQVQVQENRDADGDGEEDIDDCDGDDGDSDSDSAVPPPTTKAHKRPQGRAPSGKTWDAHTGQWIGVASVAEQDGLVGGGQGGRRKNGGGSASKAGPRKHFVKSAGARTGTLKRQVSSSGSEDDGLEDTADKWGKPVKRAKKTRCSEDEDEEGGGMSDGSPDETEYQAYYTAQDNETPFSIAKDADGEFDVKAFIQLNWKVGPHRV